MNQKTEKSSIQQLDKRQSSKQSDVIPGQSQAQLDLPHLPSSAATPPPLTPYNALKLQTMIGNQRVQRLLADRKNAAVLSLPSNHLYSAGLGRTPVQLKPRPSVLQRWPMSRDWRHEAERMSLEELEREIQALRAELGDVAESSDEAEGLAIFERALAERQAGSNRFRESVVESRGRQRELLESENDPASSAVMIYGGTHLAFIRGFTTGYASEIPPGELADLERELQEHWVEFDAGTKVGSVVGYWHGLTGLIEGIGTLLELGFQTSPLGMFMNLAEEAVEFAGDPEAYMQQRRRDYEQLRAISQALQAFAQEFQADPTIVMQLSGDLGLAFGQELGQLTTTDFLRQSPYQKGYILGDIAGQIGFEVLLEIILALATEGVGNLLRGVAAVGQGARAGGRVARVIRRILEASPALRRLFRALTGAEDAADAARLAEHGADAARAGGDEAVTGGGRLSGAVDEGVGGAGSAVTSSYDTMTLEQLQNAARTDREAADALWGRYQRMDIRELRQRAQSGDETAQAVLAQRPEPNRVAERLGRRHGPADNPEMQDRLSADIQGYRDEVGIQRIEPLPGEIGQVEGGTVGAARTDIPGLENEVIRGASPQAGGTPDPSFQPASSHGAAQGHAEQNIAGSLDRRLETLLQSGTLTRDQLQGRTVWMRIEQEVCSTCRSGVENPNATLGVLGQISQRYPELTFMVRTPDSSEFIVLRGGRRVN